MRTRRLVEATRRHLEVMGPGVLGEPVTTIEVVILGLLADEPDFFAEPLPPFGELFEGTGLEAHRNFIGFAGHDWSVLDQFGERVSAAGDEDDGIDGAFGDDADADDENTDSTTRLSPRSRQPSISTTRTTTLGIVLDMYLAWRVPLPDGACPADSPAMRRNLAELVGLERVALALADYAWTDPGLEAFVVDLRAGASRGRLATGPEFLLGACADARAAVEEAEGHYLAALAVDPGFWPARLPCTATRSTGATTRQRSPTCGRSACRRTTQRARGWRHLCGLQSRRSGGTSRAHAALAASSRPATWAKRRRTPRRTPPMRYSASSRCS